MLRNWYIELSILSANFLELNKLLESIDRETSIDWIHLDIMDGVFVPNISFGFPVIKPIISAYRKRFKFHAHLMIVNPDRYIHRFADIGCDIITVHYETCPHLHRTVQNIKACGCAAGVAINPHTPVFMLENILHELDLVLVMSVNPGFGGQKFIPETINKINQLSRLISKKKTNTRIAVDGGVDETNLVDVLNAGASIAVIGSAITDKSDPAAFVNRLLTETTPP